jgi:hypothetical protein
MTINSKPLSLYGNKNVYKIQSSNLNEIGVRFLAIFDKSTSYKHVDI